MSPAQVTQAGVGGAWMHNPVTGELARVRVGAEETDGRRVEADLWVRPGGAVAGAHTHPHLVERFTVVAGALQIELAGTKRTLRPQDGTVEVPVGVVHDWWNAGDEVAQVRVEVEAQAQADAPGAAARFLSVIETLWSLAVLGHVDETGMPGPLWLAAIGREYRDTIRFVRPPAPVQALVIGPLAALARRTGHDPSRADLHGPAAACVISLDLAAALERVACSKGVRFRAPATPAAVNARSRSGVERRAASDAYRRLQRLTQPRALGCARLVEAAHRRCTARCERSPGPRRPRGGSRRSCRRGVERLLGLVSVGSTI